LIATGCVFRVTELAELWLEYWMTDMLDKTITKFEPPASLKTKETSNMCAYSFCLYENNYIFVEELYSFHPSQT